MSNLKDQDCQPSYPSYLIVIDALDDCDSRSNVQIILQCLAKVHSLQSTQVRVLLTSRPESPIQYGFTQVQREEHRDFILHNIEPAIIQHDISVFFRHNLNLIRQKYELRVGWPGESDIKLLVENSGGLFIWAATACRFIDEDSQLAETRLHSLVNQQGDAMLPPERKLDEIYTTVLASSIRQNHDKSESQMLHTLFRQVVGPIVMLQDSLSVTSLAELLGKDIADLRRTLVNLNSVLHVPAAGPEAIQLLHPSFRDFLVDKSRCSDLHFRVKKRLVHREMYKHCLRLISKHLHRDICNLQDPGALVADLSKIDVDRYIQPNVQYACRFWVYHCVQSDVDKSNCADIELFFQKHFLHWLEVLTLLNYGSDAVHMVHMLDDLFSVSIPRS